MSATGRNLPGAERHALDYYETPAFITDAFLPYLRPHDDGVILDAGCGSGAITERLIKYYPGRTVAGCDIEFRPEFFERCPSALFFHGDFLDDGSPTISLKIAAVIMNPPFKDAQAFIERALDLTQGQVPVAALLRLNFAGGQERAPWLRKLQPSIYISPRRPSFTDDGKTDASEYAFFLFDGKAKVVWLETEKK